MDEEIILHCRQIMVDHSIEINDLDEAIRVKWAIALAIDHSFALESQALLKRLTEPKE